MAVEIRDNAFCVEVEHVDAREPRADEVWLAVESPNEFAPSEGLLRWFGYEAENWYEFRRRYHRELEKQSVRCERLHESACRSRLVLTYCHGNAQRNIALALKQYLEILECHRRWQAGWIIGGYNFPVREEIHALGGLWFAQHKAYVMPSRTTWQAIQNLLPGDF